MLLRRSIPRWGLDFLKGKRLEERLVIKAGLAEHVGEGGGTTNPVRVTLEDRSLRNCCQNSVAIAALVLADTTNERIVSLIVSASESLLDWHTTQSQELRDVTRTSAWLLDQISGGIEGHINTTLRSLMSVKVLDKCGFLRPPPTDPDALEYALLLEDDFADIAGQYVVALVAQRRRRLLYLLEGWPWKAQLCRKGGAVADKTINEFHTDWNHFNDHGSTTQHHLNTCSWAQRP